MLGSSLGFLLGMATGGNTAANRASPMTPTYMRQFQQYLQQMQGGGGGGSDDEDSDDTRNTGTSQEQRRARARQRIEQGRRASYESRRGQTSDTRKVQELGRKYAIARNLRDAERDPDTGEIDTSRLRAMGATDDEIEMLKELALSPNLPESPGPFRRGSGGMSYVEAMDAYDAYKAGQRAARAAEIAENSRRPDQGVPYFTPNQRSFLDEQARLEQERRNRILGPMYEQRRQLHEDWRNESRLLNELGPTATTVRARTRPPRVTDPELDVPAVVDRVTSAAVTQPGPTSTDRVIQMVLGGQGSAAPAPPRPSGITPGGPEPMAPTSPSPPATQPQSKPTRLRDLPEPAQWLGPRPREGGYEDPWVFNLLGMP